MWKTIAACIIIIVIVSFIVERSLRDKYLIKIHDNLPTRNDRSNINRVIYIKKLNGMLYEDYKTIWVHLDSDKHRIFLQNYILTCETDQSLNDIVKKHIENTERVYI